MGSVEVAVYKLKQGTIETNYHYEVVGVSRAYIHLLGRDITDVIHRPEGRGIRKLHAGTHQEANMPFVRQEQRRFRQYGKNVLRKRIT